MVVLQTDKSCVFFGQIEFSNVYGVHRKNPTSYLYAYDDETEEFGLFSHNNYKITTLKWSSTLQESKKVLLLQSLVLWLNTNITCDCEDQEDLDIWNAIWTT
jgi:hypothetical protein